MNSEEERCEVLRYEIEAKKSRENRELTQREERLNTNEAVKLKIKHKSDDEILEKPVYKQQICTSLTFVKRTKKSKILI